jgi:MFS family permease
MISQISAGIAGLATGPLFWNVAAKRFGKCASIAWGMVITLTFNIWSACMTKPDQYNAFVVSRLFAGLASAAPTTGTFSWVRFYNYY